MSTAMKVLAAVIIVLIIIICLLIDELVKMSRLLGLFEDELVDAQNEIRRLKAITEDNHIYFKLGIRNDASKQIKEIKEICESIKKGE